MIGLIITGHGNFATGLFSSMTLIGGEPEKCIPVDFEGTMSTEQLQEKLEQAINTLTKEVEGIIICSDLAGGSPFKTAAMLQLEHKNIEIIAGTNLPMLLEANMSKEYMSDAKSFANQLVNTAKDQVVLLDLASMMKKNDEPTDGDGI